MHSKLRKRKRKSSNNHNLNSLLFLTCTHGKKTKSKDLKKNLLDMKQNWCVISIPKWKLLLRYETLPSDFKLNENTSF